MLTIIQSKYGTLQIYWNFEQKQNILPQNKVNKETENIGVRGKALTDVGPW